MTNKPRRTRSDSISNLHRIMTGANVMVAPPVHIKLDAMDLPFWEDIISEFATADWTAHSRDMAAILSRLMADLEREQRTLSNEGMMVERRDDTLGLNPRSRVVDKLTSQVLAVRRSLGLTGRAKAGSTRDAARQREANRRTEQGLRGIDPDGLLS